MSVYGNIVRCTEFDSIRIEVQSEGHGLMIPAKSILAIDRLLMRCRQGHATLSLTLTLLLNKADWDASYHESIPGGESQVVLAHGSTPWAALVALAEMLGE